MTLNSLPLYTSISQWALFLGIGLILIGIIDKREYYILAGQIVFIGLGLMAIWILFPHGSLQDENLTRIPKAIKSLAFFKATIYFMGLTTLILLQRLLKLPYQKASLYLHIFFALLLFFMLFNILQMPNIQ
jgi:hypothetical protein